MIQKLHLLVTCVLLSFVCCAQEGKGGRPLSWQITSEGILEPNAEKLITPDVNALELEDVVEDAKGPYRIGKNLQVSLNTSNSGTWTTDANGNSIWRLKVSAKGAKALSLIFTENVRIPAGAKLFAYNKNRKQLLGAFTHDGDQFDAMQMVQGEDIFLEYNAPSYVNEQPLIFIKEVVYMYRGVDDFIVGLADNATEKAENCEIDVVCSEGAAWGDQINSVIHFQFTLSGSTFVCSGSLLNNTNQDCKPYILTAWHCGERTVGSSLSGWVWYWKYQKATCQPGAANGTDPSTGSFSKTGGTVRASSGNGTLNNPPTAGEVAGSDFYLVEIGSSINATYNPFYAGWNRTNTAASSGVGIHHPSGSAKKISTYTGALVSATYNGGAPNAHWRVVWTGTANGHGVTEGGSSGSPIFNQLGQVMGQLSGGSSFCASTSSPDLYGKFFTNWDQCGITADSQLKPWLDPTNTGVSTLAGAASPCTSSPTSPVANFSATPTTMPSGTTSSFTDLSTNSPTSWSWSVSPAVGWAYAGGTGPSVQNPQITFNTAGTYSVTLTATNGSGSDSEVKNGYINVTSSTSPCAASATQVCAANEEYISNVSFVTINNTTVCGQYTAFNQTATVVKGQTYPLTLNPMIVGNPNPTAAYVDDEMAVWIDFNNDLDFNDAGERVFYVLVGSTGFTQSILIPTTAVTGVVNMRTRLSYSGAGGSAINPCGTVPFGETEDYKVNIQVASNAGIEETVFDAAAIYPNPTNEFVFIDLSSLTGQDIELSLLDITGKVLQTKIVKAGNTISFDVNNLATGMYQIQFEQNGVKAIKRIIRN